MFSYPIDCFPRLRTPIIVVVFSESQIFFLHNASHIRPWLKKGVAAATQLSKCGSVSHIVCHLFPCICIVLNTCQYLCCNIYQNISSGAETPAMMVMMNYKIINPSHLINFWTTTKTSTLLLLHCYIKILLFLRRKHTQFINIFTFSRSALFPKT